MTDYALAAKVIAGFESFQSYAKWDVNAYRLGYGSDTEGPEQRRVVHGMVTTRERALANLSARIPQYEKVIVGQVGAREWAKLSDRCKAALLSFAYNYGKLTIVLARLVSIDNLRGAAREIAARGVDNRGINHNRRVAESELFLSGIK